MTRAVRRTALGRRLAAAGREAAAHLRGETTLTEYEVTVPPAITAERVRGTFQAKHVCPRWQPPGAADCAMIAHLLTAHAKKVAARRMAEGRTLREQRARVADALKVLVADLPAVREGANPAAAARWPEAMAALQRLEAAVRDVWTLAHDLAPSAESAWTAEAGVLIHFVHDGLQRANPGRRLGLAQSKKAPVAKALAALLALAGETIEAGTVGQRIKRAGFFVS